MITTVTANPSLDRTVHLAQFTRGTVHRGARAILEPSGKGVNVALALAAAGHPVTAVLPVGGSTGAQLVALLDEAGLAHRDVSIGGAVRSNISLIESDGTTSKINEPGPHLSPAEVAELIDASLAGGRPAEWVAWCGSLPTGFGDDALAGAVGRARSAGRRVALDASGSALATVLLGPPGLLPHLIKPNADELRELVGRPLRTLGDVVDAAALQVERGVQTVLVSLGVDGALLVDRRVVRHGQAPVARVVNTAGAGDAFLAGYLAADGEPADDRLSSALRFGAAAVGHGGTVLDRPDPNQPVQLFHLDRARELRAPTH